MNLEEAICHILLSHLEFNGFQSRDLHRLLQRFNLQSYLITPEFDMRGCLREADGIIISWGFKPKHETKDDSGWDRARKAGFTRKIWWTEQDDRVRDEHELRHHEIKPINQRFSRQFKPGKAPMFPRDPEADISDIANCRCWLTFAMKEPD